MKKKKEIISKNYLEKIPCPSQHLKWDADDEKMVTLYIENTGFFNTIAQKLFKKPRITQIHLDKMGSFIWPLMDGEKDIIELGKLVETEFGDEANPLYERLAKFFQILDSYNFITWNK